MRKGFESAGGRCVFTSERDTYAQKTYQANFPGDSHDISGDITSVRSEDIPAHDVLLAGFPCQPFSLAGMTSRKQNGKGSGFSCPSQGGLFFEIVRILACHRPRAFVLENVKNLMNHDGGRTWDIILQTLSLKLGYHVQFRCINSRFWVPQNRERVFITGFQEKTGFSIESMCVSEGLKAPVLRDILHPEDGSETGEDPYTQGHEGKVSPKYTLSDRVWSYLQSHALKHGIRGNGFGYSLANTQGASRTLSARYGKDGSEILIPQHGRNPRRLTPRECSRLMGFDQPGESRFRIPVSDTQAYRQFGNAVVVPVVEALARHMLPWISRTREYVLFFSSPTSGGGETTSLFLLLF